MKKGVEQTLKKVPIAGESIVEHIRKTKSGIKQLLVPGMFFEDMGITYLGPVDGHNLGELCRAFQEAKKLDNAVILHVVTEKGKGYLPAEEEPSKFHGTGPFDIETGQALGKKDGETYTDVFGKVMCDIGANNPKVVAITAAMKDGTGLSEFAKRYKKRFFDVGIAEEHGVTFAAGLAAGGLKPVFAVYSSFLQRGYDQMIHDVALQNLPVVFAIDRAGIVGNDGETHQGIFDLSYLSSIPNMTVISPKNKWELADMIRYAVSCEAPVAIRYPRGKAYTGLQEYRKPIRFQTSEVIYEENEIAILSIGHMMEIAEKARKKLKEMGYNCSLINGRFVKPIDEEILVHLAKDHRLFVTVEENVLSGGYGEKVREFVMRQNLPVDVLTLGIPDEYVEHGNIDILRKEIMLDEDSIVKQIVTQYIGLAR